jgi:hypothetical protein
MRRRDQWLDKLCWTPFAGLIRAQRRSEIKDNKGRKRIRKICQKLLHEFPVILSL